MKEAALVFLLLLLAKNLQIISWDDDGVSVDVEGTHERIVNVVEGDS